MIFFVDIIQFKTVKVYSYKSSIRVLISSFSFNEQYSLYFSFEIIFVFYPDVSLFDHNFLVIFQLNC